MYGERSIFGFLLTARIGCSLEETAQRMELSELWLLVYRA